MRTLIRSGAVLVALSLAIAFAPRLGGAAAVDAASTHSAVTHRAAFHDAMRKLWEDHITWTRLFIVSAATDPSNLPDIGPTVDRLLANQVDIGNAIKPFYGTAAGEQLTALLGVHILTAAEVLADAKAGDAPSLADASARWYANGDEIATFLSTANPANWPLADMKAMMKAHLDLTLAEAVARLQGRYADDVVGYDRVHAEILEMADMLSDGIIRQFPEQFAH
ncbi:MAG: hypothetical protein Q7S35_11195 [Candidatus Limnocylindrales bacterium]|nr:hypothetical protein [Candidatus Limnocylindrales bacterium]